MTEVVVGLKEVVDRMKDFPVKLQRRAARAAVLSAARVVAAQVRKDAPRLTGAIRKNVVAKSGRPRNATQTRAIIGVRHGKVKTRGSTIRLKDGGFRVGKLTAYDKRGQDPFYYRFQELGFTAVGRRKAANRAERKARKAGAGRQIPGKKFLTNALPKTASRALAVMRASFAKQIDRIAKT